MRKEINQKPEGLKRPPPPPAPPPIRYVNEDKDPHQTKTKSIKVNKGTNKDPVPDALYCVYTKNGRGNSIGNILLGAECNWFSSEIVGWSLLPVYVNDVIELYDT